MRHALFLACSFFCCLALATRVYALTFVLPDAQNNIIGHVQWTQALPGDTFDKIGRRYDLGYLELMESNPTIDPVHPIPGTIIVLPSRFILPPGPRKGLVINLAELRAYYYPPHRHIVHTYPVGIGREGWDTPLGDSWIAQKIIDPVWQVPTSIRKDRAKDGVHLPSKVPPGPDNPLGGYAMRLKQETYLIHGTNSSEGIGRRSSAGCIRMFPEDIEELFPQMKRKERVFIMDSPYKIGWAGDKLYLEVHTPLQWQPGLELTYIAAVKAYVQKNIQINNARIVNIQLEKINAIARDQNGIPQIIGHAAETQKPSKHDTTLQKTKPRLRQRGNE